MSFRFNPTPRAKNAKTQAELGRRVTKFTPMDRGRRGLEPAPVDGPTGTADSATTGTSHPRLPPPSFWLPAGVPQT